MKKMSDKELKGKDGGLFVTSVTGNAIHSTHVVKNTKTGQKVLRSTVPSNTKATRISPKTKKK